MEASFEKILSFDRRFGVKCDAVVLWIMLFCVLLMSCEQLAFFNLLQQLNSCSQNCDNISFDSNFDKK